MGKYKIYRIDQHGAISVEIVSANGWQDAAQAATSDYSRPCFKIEAYSGQETDLSS